MKSPTLTLSCYFFPFAVITFHHPLLSYCGSDGDDIDDIRGDASSRFDLISSTSDSIGLIGCHY